MIYIIIALLLLLSVLYFDLGKDKPNNNNYYWAWLVIFILLASLRYRVGADTLGYIEYYKTIKPFSINSISDIFHNEYQPLWVLLCSFLKIFTNSFILFQFVHAIFINTVIFRFIKKYSKFKFTGILLYFIFYYLYFNMEILRESIAVCILLLSIDFFINTKWFKYYIMVTIAFFFHITAIIMIFFPFVKKRLTYFSFVIIVFIIPILVYLFRSSFLDIILNIFTYDKIMHAAKTYLRAQINFNGIIYILSTKVLLPLFLLFINEFILKVKLIFKPLLYLYIFLWVLSIVIEPFYRFTNYLLPFYILFIGDFLHNLYRNSFFYRLRFQVVTLLFAAILFIQINRLVKDTSNKVSGTRYYRIWIPYYTVFNKEIDTQREELVSKFNGFVIKKKNN